MLDQIVSTVVDDQLDWFFNRVLKEHYDLRRKALKEAKKTEITAIDYILKTYINKDIKYPPDSAKEWTDYYAGLQSNNNCLLKQLLLIYLRLDVDNHLSPREDDMSKTRTKDKAELNSLKNVLSELMKLPHAFDFKNSVVHLATGLWAVDNQKTKLILTELGNPLINLTNYFESPRELINIIIDSLIIAGEPRKALYMSKIHRYENWDDEYDVIYAFLLISSGQLIEALKYERLFVERENYHDILNTFFQLCSEKNATKSLNCLNLSVEEEEMLNQHMVSESRPETPCSSQTPRDTSSRSISTKRKPRNRSIQAMQRTPSFNDSPARNTRSARKRKTEKIKKLD